MREYQSQAHTKWKWKWNWNWNWNWNCKYHVVFIPKKRKKVIFGEILARYCMNSRNRRVAR